MPRLHHVLNFAIAMVWMVNGLACKLLDIVPRHREIVARILGADHAGPLTKLIGGAEIVMTVWILSRRWSKLCAALQVAVILAMNVIEFVLVPDLLLFGRWNLLFALLLSTVIAINAFLPPVVENRTGK